MTSSVWGHCGFALSTLLSGLGDNSNACLHRGARLELVWGIVLRHTQGYPRQIVVVTKYASSASSLTTAVYGNMQLWSDARVDTAAKSPNLPP